MGRAQGRRAVRVALQLLEGSRRWGKVITLPKLKALPFPIFLAQNRKNIVAVKDNNILRCEVGVPATSKNPIASILTMIGADNR